MATGNHNRNDVSSSSSRKRIIDFENNAVAPWSELHDHVLYLVMMKLGVVDFFAFSEVCKSWKSLALSNRNKFLMSRPPMKIYKKDSYYYLEDYERRMFRTIIPHSGDRICCGVTCGYLILFRREARDFWLVNPITRHQLYFPNYPLSVGVDEVIMIRAVIVFSPSISRWMFVMVDRNTSPHIVSFYIVGKHGWNHVHSTLPIIDLHAFKGKIYTLHADCSLSELRLNPNHKRKWMLLETKNLPKPDLLDPELVSSHENLYIISPIRNKVIELDFGEMKWASREKTHAFFLSSNESCAGIQLESLSQFKNYDYCLRFHKSRHMFYYEWMWYMFKC